MEMKSRVFLLENGRRFMGIGVFWLLKEVDRCGSLRQAALNLELSYTKALRMIGGLEDAVGRKILSRRHGGRERQGAVLTEFGAGYILLYESFQNSVAEAAAEAFGRFSEGLEALKAGAREV